MTTPAAAYPGSSLTTRARIPRAIVAAYGVLVPVSRSFQTTSASSHAAVTQSRNVKAANAPASPHTGWSWGTSSSTSPAQMSPIARPRPVGMLPVPSIRASCSCWGAPDRLVRRSSPAVRTRTKTSPTSSVSTSPSSPDGGEPTALSG